MKLITIDVIKETFDVAAVEGSSNSIQIYFKNTPDEWRDDSVGVFVLFAKGSKSQIFPIDKETMTTDVLNNMLSENSGFKVTVFAMNSDIENPYRDVFPPIWVEVRQGYECDVSSAPDRDNMDAICVLLQVLMSYDEAEAQRKINEEERQNKIADFDAEFSEYKNIIHSGEEVYDASSKLAQSGKAVAQAVASIVNSAPETLNTLEELAKALGNDPNFATTIMNLIGNKTENRIFESAIGELREDSVIHKSNQLNPHFVTKEQVGLGNVDNTADIDKPVSDAAKAELDKKVDKTENFGLTLMEPVPDEEDDSGYSWDKVYFENKPYIPGEDVTRLVEVYSADGADKKFVGKVDGKGLSTNDFTDAFMNQLKNMPLVNLGVFNLNLDSGSVGFNEDVYQSYLDTIDNLDSGIYTLKFMEAGYDRTEFYFVTKGKSVHGDYSSQIRFNDNSVFSNYSELMDIERREYFNGKWSAWISLTYELNSKVNKEEGKGLSTNDFTDTDKQTLKDTRYDADALIEAVTTLREDIDNKVDKVENYGLINIDDHFNGYNFISGLYDLRFNGINTTAGGEVVTICSKGYVHEAINPSPIKTTPATLETNNQYNFGEVESLSLTFPTVANDGDVIYLTFYSGATPTTLTIDTTNTCDIEVIPEANTGYEIFGKYNGDIWIVNYSEYTVSEV